MRRSYLARFTRALHSPTQTSSLGGNMEVNKTNYMLDQFRKHTEEKRLGCVEVVKTILSIVSVLIALLATLETINPHKPDLCSHPVEFVLKFLPYLFLFLCSGFCLHHLNYSLNTHHSKMNGLLVEAMEKSSSFEQAYNYLKQNPTFPAPYLYQKSLTIIFSLFTLGLVFTVARII